MQRGGFDHAESAVIHMKTILCLLIFSGMAAAQCGSGGTFLGIGKAGDILCTGKTGTGTGDMLSASYVLSGSGPPVGSCTTAGAFYRDTSVTPYGLYTCGANSGAWIGPFTSYDGTKSGAILLSGLTSGASGLAVLDAAGSQILYVMPVWNGSDSLAGKILQDSGTVSCGTLATSLAGIPCHQLVWANNTAGGTTSASFCLSSTGPCWNNASGTLKSVTDAAGATDAPVEASGFNTPSGTAFEASGATQSAPTVTVPTIYFDASAGVPQFLNSSSVLAGTMVAPIADPGSDHKWLKYVPNTGGQTRTQPACADVTNCVPDTRTVAGHALTGNVTITPSDVSLGNVTNDVQTKNSIVPNTAPSAGQILIGNAGNTAYAKNTMTGDCSLTSAGAISCYDVWECQAGLGDGLNTITSGTYSQHFCRNNTGGTVTVTGIQCFSDNSGSSTLDVKNSSAVSLLTGAITCTGSYASGTQSATVTIASGSGLVFTFVADGTTKETSWVIVGHR